MTFFVFVFFSNSFHDMWDRAILTLLMSRAQRYLQASCIAATSPPHPNFAVQPWTTTLWQHSVPTLSCYQSHPHRAAPHKQVWPCADLTGWLKKCKRGQRSCLDNHRAFTWIILLHRRRVHPAYEGRWWKHPAGRTGSVSLCFRVGGKKERWSKSLFPELQYVELMNEIIDHFSHIRHEKCHFNINSIPIYAHWREIMAQNHISEGSSTINLGGSRLISTIYDSFIVFEFYFSSATAWNGIRGIAVIELC